MLDNLIQQFAGGGASSMEGPALHDNVGQMLDAAPQNHVTGAVSEALGSLGGGGFAQSVQQGAANAGPEQRSGLASMLLSAVEKDGGSSSGVASQFGMGVGVGGAGPPQLASLAEHVFNSHGGALAGVMGTQLNSGSGGSSGVLAVLGNPMARKLGMSLAGKLM
ncbi:MAG: hypothetical protein ACR2JC_09115 [Chloroflexota bacterium]|nr:MAG: hypothetical protein DLM70_07080 [Chloroflexota bacterium]